LRRRLLSWARAVKSSRSQASPARAGAEQRRPRRALSRWPADKILDKTGIQTRHIAAPNETAVDLAEAAAKALFAQGAARAGDLDYLLFCTQTPDHILPTSACILQQRLGLRTDIGALDFNLGCSGFVYGLSLAQALIASGQARRVLLLTADTYSKLIHPMDRGVRSLFGDGAAATMVEAVETDAPALGPFVFGTDGAGAENLIVPAGGFRHPRDADDRRGRDGQPRAICARPSIST
jgi:3-oxoacyl-[acyl-carrier-protein] synthase-3